jgi:hypothetical protein
MTDKKLEKTKQEEYLAMLYPDLDIPGIISNPIEKRVKKMAAPTLDIPSIEDKPTGGAPLSAAAPPPLPGGAPGEASTGLPPLPDDSAGVAPPTPEPPKEEKPKKKDMSSKEKEELLSSLDELREQIKEVRSELEMSVMKDEIIEKVQSHYKGLEEELNSLKKKEIPERKYFDTEGAYRDRLYGMATNMLDEFLPALFEEIPEYNFTATQVSRMFEDGTVADALILLMATVPREGMKYDFKIEVPVLNGLMQYPMYIQRGQKIVPLTKAEIQRELNSMSYRKLDIEEPYKKDNIYNNIGENTHRRPDKQKWYETAPNTYNQVAIPPDHIQSPQRGKGVQ